MLSEASVFLNSLVAPDLSQSPGPSPPHLLLCRPGDKRIVREAGSEGDIWWGEGSTNFEMDER